MKPFSVLIVDDHTMFREALQIALSLESDFDVVGQFPQRSGCSLNIIEG